ncbi:RhaT Permeases of the drug/metabolite transporter (DMT) superfamily [Candidatus Nanopelagicaceae bacterium]
MSFIEKIKAREVDIALLIVAALWGASYLSAKTLTEHAPVLTVLSLRFIVTSLAMAIIWAIKHERFTRAELALGIGLGTSQGLILYCETNGVSRTSATNAGLIISLAIIFTPIFESIASKNWLPRPFFVATVVAVVGVALLVSDKGFAAPGLGDWLMLAAALFRALHVTAMGHLTSDKKHSSVSITLLQSLTCAVMYSVFSFDGIKSAVREFDRGTWLNLLFLSLLCGAFAFLVTLWAIRRTSSSRASLLLGTEPVWAVVVGISIGGESLAVLGVIGAALIIGSSYFGQKIETHHRTRSS